MDDFTNQILNQVHELTSEEIENSPTDFYNTIQEKLATQTDEPDTDPKKIDISHIGFIYKYDPIYTLLLNHYGTKNLMLKQIPGAIETESRLFFTYDWTSNGNTILASLFKTS